MTKTLSQGQLAFRMSPQWVEWIFLVTDLELMLDVFYTSLSSYAIRGDEKLHIMFELSHTINNLLKVFEKRYSE